MIDVLLFFVPAVATNLLFNVFYESKRKLNLLKYDYPFDCNLSLGNNRLLGDSTTWGGLIIAIIFGLIIIKNFPNSHALELSLLAFFGHALGSFIKRRLGKKRGEYLPIIDHGDYMILSSLYFIIAGVVEWKCATVATIVVLIVQPLISYLAWRVGLRDNKL